VEIKQAKIRFLPAGRQLPPLEMTLFTWKADSYLTSHFQPTKGLKMAIYNNSISFL
jgi:hypothetical protein